MKNFKYKYKEVKQKMVYIEEEIIGSICENTKRLHIATTVESLDILKIVEEFFTNKGYKVTCSEYKNTFRKLSTNISNKLEGESLPGIIGTNIYNSFSYEEEGIIVPQIARCTTEYLENIDEYNLIYIYHGVYNICGIKKNIMNCINRLERNPYSIYIVEINKKKVLIESIVDIVKEYIEDRYIEKDIDIKYLYIKL